MDDSSPAVSELTFDDKIALLEEELPTPIRDFLHSPERDATSLRLSQKYRLHADQAAAFERAYLYMLLGVNTPRDFVDDLKRAGIDADSIKGLTNDINEEVFKKLHRKEFQEADSPKLTRQPVAPQVPVMQVVPPPPTPPKPQPAPSFNLVAHDPQPPEPMMRTMQSDMSAIQHQSTPAPIPFPLPQPSQMTPSMSFHSASIPYTVTRPSNPQTKALETRVKIVPSKPVPVVPPIEPVPASGGDPYREPIA